MATLTRWDPFQTIMNVQNEMNQLFGNWPQNGSTWGLALDVRERDDAFIVQASVPGVHPDDLDISLVNNTLTIQGETHPGEQQGQVHLQELSYGKFYRSLRLPVPVESDQVDASYENGVLTLTLPKAEEAKPKRIAIRNNGHQTIEGTSS